jgi:hypothetical protein
MVLFETSSQLNYFLHHSEAKYDVLMFSLKILRSMKVKHVTVFSDSLLII